MHAGVGGFDEDLACSGMWAKFPVVLTTLLCHFSQEATSEPSRKTSSSGASDEASHVAEGSQASFKTHPARRQLREFMQVLLRELLLGVSSPKQWLPLEVLLEVG